MDIKFLQKQDRNVLAWEDGRLFQRPIQAHCLPDELFPVTKKKHLFK